jgi:hypothetical protein
MKPLLKPRVCCLLAHTLLSALPLCEVGAARAARWRTLLFHVRIGPQKLNQYEFRLAPADERVWNCHVYNEETQGKPIRGTATKPTRLDHEFTDLATFSGFAMARAETLTTGASFWTISISFAVSLVSPGAGIIVCGSGHTHTHIVFL